MYISYHFNLSVHILQVRIAAEEDEIKKQYWNILKKKYLNDEQIMNDPKMKRKIRIIKERGTNVQMPQSKVFVLNNSDRQIRNTTIILVTNLDIISKILQVSICSRIN